MAVALQPAQEVTAMTKPPIKQRRVVVTGLGVVTPLGHELDVFYNNLLDGVSGISEIDAFDCAEFPTRIAGQIKSFSTDGWVALKLSKRMDKFMLYVLTAGKKALADGGISEDVMGELNKAKCGVLIGSAMGDMQEIQWKKENVLADLKREKALLDMAKFNFNKKKNDFLKFLASSSSYATQRPQLVKGNMQLFFVDQQRSQALEAHAASFAQFKVLDSCIAMKQANQQ